MKPTLPLLLALSVPAVAQAAPAQPTTPRKATRPAPLEVDPAIKALLDQSAKAYADLKGLSEHFVTYSNDDEKGSVTSGDISFSRPDKAKVTIQTAKANILTVASGDKLYSQSNPKSYRQYDLDKDTQIRSVLGRIPSLFSTIASIFADGKSPLESGIRWTGASALPDNGVSLALKLGKTGPAYKFNLYFDPTDSLLRRTEISLVYKGKTNSGVTVLSDIQANPDFADDAFTYAPPPGAKLAVDPPMFNPNLKVGVKPFALKGKDLNGKTHAWKDYEGKVVLLDFWATWCGPCVGELPNVLDKYKKYHKDGFEIVAVSLDEKKKDLTDFIKARKLTYTQLFDGKGWKNVDSTRYGVMAIPFTLLIGKDGRIAAVNPRGDLLEPALKKALAK